MGILGIDNRTENWKTARTFAPFFGNQPALRRLAGRLLPEPLDDEEKVNLELFWTGGRDYWVKHKPSPGELAAIFRHYFSELGDEIKKGDWRFKSLKCHNYNVGEVEKLATNFRNTEFDIVLETSKHLLIGEAKDESSFGTDGGLVLVHQLIRQYVTAQILVHLVNETQPKRVVPFVIAPEDPKKGKSLRNKSQVKFMTGYPKEDSYLKESNILSWADVNLSRLGAAH